MNLFPFQRRETKAKVVRGKERENYIGELIQEECFEREKWERKNRIVRTISDRGRETEREEKLSQGESQTQK